LVVHGELAKPDETRCDQNQIYVANYDNQRIQVSNAKTGVFCLTIDTDNQNSESKTVAVNLISHEIMSLAEIKYSYIIILRLQAECDNTASIIQARFRIYIQKSAEIKYNYIIILRLQAECDNTASTIQARFRIYPTRT
jgi:DNA-binding beta-propeller fold protein YncE